MTRDFENIAPFLFFLDPSMRTCTQSPVDIGFKSKKYTRRQFPIDLKETETHYILYADLPGYSKDQVGLDFNDQERILHIVAKTTTSIAASDGANSTSPEKDEKEKWIFRERPSLLSTECERFVELPKDAVADQATASLVDGVLEIRIPRQLPKKYQIQLH